MSTNINITVDSSNLTIAAKLFQETSRQSKQQEESEKILELKIEKERSDNLLASSGQTGQTVQGGQTSTQPNANNNATDRNSFGYFPAQPYRQRRPAANRRGDDIVQIASASRVTQFTQVATAPDPLLIDQAIAYNVKGQVYGKRVPSIAEFQGEQRPALVEIIGNPYDGTIIRDFRPDEIPPAYVSSGGPFNLPYIYGLSPNYQQPGAVGLGIDSGAYPQDADVAIVLKQFKGVTIETYHKAFGAGVAEVSLGCDFQGLDTFDFFSVGAELVRAYIDEPPAYTESWTRDIARVSAFSIGGVSYQDNRLFGENGSFRPPAGQWIHSCLVVEPDKASLYTNGILTIALTFEIPIPQAQYTINWGTGCSGMSSTEGLGPESGRPEVRLQIPYGWAVSRFTSRPRYRGNFTPGRIDIP
jgi:hypothetical protein